MTSIKTIAAGAVIALTMSGITASAATMTTLSTNTGSDPIEVDVLIENTGVSGVTFTLTVDPTNTGNIADLRGFFFDYAGHDPSAGFSFSSSQGLGSIETSGSVISFPGGVNLNGGGVTPFDVGLTIGTPGIGSDDFQTYSFFMDQSDITLREDNFFGQRMGVRGTSTGPVGSGRDGSSKVVGTVPVPPAVPLPAAGWMLLAGLGGLGAVRMKRRAA